MILPSKHLSEERALLTVGARILQRMDRPKTISALWEEIASRAEKPALRYDRFVLGLDLLFLINAIEWEGGMVFRKSP